MTRQSFKAASKIARKVNLSMAFAASLIAHPNQAYARLPLVTIEELYANSQAYDEKKIRLLAFLERDFNIYLGVSAAMFETSESRQFTGEPDLLCRIEGQYSVWIDGADLEGVEKLKAIERKERDLPAPLAHLAVIEGVFSNRLFFNGNESQDDKWERSMSLNGPKAGHGEPMKILSKPKIIYVYQDTCRITNIYSNYMIVGNFDYSNIK